MGKSRRVWLEIKYFSPHHPFDDLFCDQVDLLVKKYLDGCIWERHSFYEGGYYSIRISYFCNFAPFNRLFIDDLKRLCDKYLKRLQYSFDIDLPESVDQKEV